MGLTIVFFGILLRISASCGIFLFRGKPAADVAFLLIPLEDFTHLCRKLRTDFGETFADVLMYGTFGDAKLPCGGSDCGTVIHNIASECNGPVIRLTVHILTPTLVPVWPAWIEPVPVSFHYMHDDWGIIPPKSKSESISLGNIPAALSVFSLSMKKIPQTPCNLLRKMI